LDSLRGAAAKSRTEAVMCWARAWGVGLDLAAKKLLEGKGRDDGVFISLFPYLTTSVAEPPFVFYYLFPGREPASCA